jgi:Integrase zinc binding domain
VEPVGSDKGSGVPGEPPQAVNSAPECNKTEKGSGFPTKVTVKVKGDLNFNLDGISLNLLFDENQDGGSKAVITTNVQTAESDDKLSVARSEELAKEQWECPKLQHICRLAKTNKGGFFVEDGLIYHRDTIYGYNVKQLVLPECRYPVVLSMTHDAPFAGHMAAKATRNRIKLHFYFPEMDKVVKDYCNSCDMCQRRAPVKVRDRIPIHPIERGDELPFNHLIMDCIGPIVPVNDPTVVKPEYNYALVLVDKYSRWPMAYPLKS